MLLFWRDLIDNYDSNFLLGMKVKLIELSGFKLTKFWSIYLIRILIRIYIKIIKFIINR